MSDLRQRIVLAVCFFTALVDQTNVIHQSVLSLLPKNACTAFCRHISRRCTSILGLSGSVQGGFPVRSLSAKASSCHSLLIDVISLLLQAVTSAKVGSVLAGRHGRTLSVTSTLLITPANEPFLFNEQNYSGSTSTRHNDRHLLYRPRNCASYSSLACGMYVGWCKTKHAQQNLSAHFFAPASNRASPDSLQHARGCTHFNCFYIECLWMAS